MAVRDANIERVQKFLEQKIVVQKLADYGVSNVRFPDSL